MKKSIIILFLLLVNNGILLSQVIYDSAEDNNTYIQQQNSFSAEDSWEIHKVAYRKQLRAEGLSEEEIEKSMTLYEAQKEKFIARLKAQLLQAQKQRERAAELRKLASEQRELADVQRKNAAEQRKVANELRKQAKEQRTKSNTQREKAKELRAQAAKLRAQADELRKVADVQRAKADIQRKKAEEWRNSFERKLTKSITLTKESASNQSITFNIDNKTTVLLNIRADISLGTALIEIYNPSGQKEGELSLEHKSISSANEEDDFFKSTSGTLNKTIQDTEVGEWKIKISSKSSEGTIMIAVDEHIK